MEASHQRKAIGEFLKTRRSGLSPKQMGLPEGYTRRRTPGLRREEVAQLADVSVTWYTWLEQGREVSASAEVLDRLASALQMRPAEREYLYQLAGRYNPSQREGAAQLTPAFKQLVNSTPYPFFVIGPENRLVAWNKTACEIFTDFSALPPEGMQMLRLIFLHPAFRAKVVNWEHTTKVAISFFRKVYDRCADQLWYNRLVREMTEQSREFAEWWPLHEVADKNGLQVEMEHASMGRLQFEIITFTQINDLDHLMCCIYMPVPDTPTAAKLADWQHAKTAKPRI